jgi:hypothetical protein
MMSATTTWLADRTTFVAVLASLIAVGSAGSYALLVSSEPGQPKLLLQRVPEAKSVKNRMHIDIHATDIDAEAARFEALGARPRQQRHDIGARE